MEKYIFAPHNPLDDRKPNLPPKGTGDSFRFMAVLFSDGTAFQGRNIFDVYMRALKHIGLEKAAEWAHWSKYRRADNPIISDRVLSVWRNKYKSYELDGYHILKLKANTYRAFLNEMSSNCNLGIQIELE